LLFVVAICGFVGVFYISGEALDGLRAWLSATTGNRYLSAFIVGGLRLSLSLLMSWVLAYVLVSVGLVRYQILETTYLIPVREFFERYGWSLAWLLLAIIGLYRIADIILGVISNVFYQDLGFSKTEIASVVKTFGLLMTIAGGFAGGLLAARFGVIRILLLGAVLAAATNLLFMILAGIGHDMVWLYIVISADNLSAGIASAAFVAFLSSLTNVSFTAIQYAIFSSLMTLLPKVLGGYSGSMVDVMGYQNFFLLTAISGIPVLLLILLVAKRLQINQ
jgi:PAT family beta-lactamase induction signal transducer AmpG